MPPLILPIIDDDEDTEIEHESNESLELSPFTPPYPPPSSSLASSYFPDVVTVEFVNVDYGIPLPLPPPRKKVNFKNKSKNL